MSNNVCIFCGENVCSRPHDTTIVNHLYTLWEIYEALLRELPADDVHGTMRRIRDGLAETGENWPEAIVP